MRRAWRFRGNIVGIDSPEALEKALRAAYYLADEGLATAAYLALALGKPLLLEGAPGVGKTEAAKAIAAVLARRLIRLQCYEGIDASAALYEWNYPRQMLAIRQAGDQSIDIYGEPFLIERPMLAALRAPEFLGAADRRDRPLRPGIRGLPARIPVRLPDLDPRARHAARRRAAGGDPDLQPHPRSARGAPAALRLSLDRLSDARARSAHRDDARLQRRRATARAVVAAVGKLRREPLSKAPGIAEAVDWAEAATLLNRSGARWPDAFKRSIGVALKDEEDLAYVSGRLDAIIAEAAA